jgi:aminopeptidase N
MTWWDDLRLNEGFATWAGWTACHKLFPEWDVWGQFIIDDMQEAFKLNTLPSSHPIRVHVPDGPEVDSIFDDISYLKSAAVIRTLAAHVGETAFSEGVAFYSESDAYGSGTAADLWAAISKSASQDIASLIEPWIERQGYPLVIAEELSTHNTIAVFQDPASAKSWPIPLLVQTSTGSRREVLTETPVEFDISTKLCTINADHAGFFRTKLSSEYSQKLCNDIHRISTHDQAGILSDAIALAWTGAGPSTLEVLEMLPKFANSTNTVVWDAIASILARVDSVFSDDHEISENLDLFTLRLAEPMLDRLGWSFTGKNEDYNTKRL